MPLIRQKYTKLDPATGQRVTHESRKWYCLYKRGLRWLRVPAYTDKAASLQMLARLERDAAREAEGMLPTEVDEHAARPIAEHVADFCRHVADRGNTPDYIQSTTQRLNYVVDGCKAKLIGDLIPSRVDRALAELVAGNDEVEGRSLCTRNHYLRAVKMFTAWAAGAERRLPYDPLVGMGFKNTDEDRRLVRRPLTQEEFSWLVLAASEGPEIAGMGGATRAMLYCLGAYTGYRRDELGSLTARSFNFGGDGSDLNGNPDGAPEPTHYYAAPGAATLTVEAGTSKRRRKETIPLHASFVGMLREFVEGELEEQSEASGARRDVEHGGGPLFEIAGARTADMLRTDLAAAQRIMASVGLIRVQSPAAADGATAGRPPGA